MTFPPPDSWYEKALALPRPRSAEGLAAMKPHEFELFSLLVISSIYGRSGLKFDPTPRSHDGGKDGDAQYVLGVGLDEALQLQFRIWLEVKQRTTQHVGKKDVGSHCVDASIEHAHTIIFVTNTVFSKNLAAWLMSFSTRTGVQHKLIDGANLLEYATKYLNGETAPPKALDGEIAKPPSLSAVCWFSLSPSDLQSRAALHPVITRQGRPIYLNIEWSIPANQRPFSGRIRVGSPRCAWSDCHPHSPGASDEQLFTPGDTLATVYTIWPAARRDWSSADFEVTVESNASPRVSVEFLNRFELEYLLLPDVPLKNQQAAYAGLLNEVAEWERTRTSRLALFVAPPGAGKSYLLTKLRRHLAARAIAEIYIDCETIRDDRPLFRHIVQELLPLPSAILDAEVRSGIEYWCHKIGLGHDATADVISDFCGADEDAARLAPRHRAELLSMLLGQRTSTESRVIVVEDLHKASPSLLTLLWQVIASLRGSGRGRTMFILCTRPYASTTSDVREKWLASLESLTTSEASTLFRLEQPSARAAHEFLSTAVAGLESYHIDAIVDTVGRSPHALREALLFLLEKETLELDGRNPQPLSVANPLRLDTVIASDKLKNATEERLAILLANQPPWLRQYLLAGAAFGRAFDANLVASAIEIADENGLDDAIDTCCRWSVVQQSSTDRDWLQFDHDLVRDTVLRVAPSRQRRRAAAALYTRLKENAQHALLARIAYQAGFPVEVLAHANQAKKQARADERLDDIVELNQLAIQTLDPELDTLSLPDPTAELGFRIDAAVRFATPVRPVGLTASDVDRQVLGLLIENLDCLASIGSGSSGLSESTLSEAAMIAERCRDAKSMARLSNLEGRLSFERDDVDRSLALHKRAEQEFERAGVGRLRARVENLIRLAICYRTLGEHDRSIEELRRAMHMVPRGEWSLFNTIRNNVGAVFLKRDWKVARQQWGKELAHAHRHKLERRTAHALLGLSFLDLFEGDLEGGAAKSRLAIAITNRLHLDNQRVRAALNMSVYCVLTRNYDEALAWLQDGETIALRHQIGRRLWRVVANLATVHELRGEPELSAIRDRQVLTLMQGDATASRPMYGRQVRAVVNVILRRDAGIGSDRPLPPLPPEAFEYARIAASRSGSLPDLMYHYRVDLPIGPRFLLTE